MKKPVKQSGGRGQYGHVVIDVKPNERGKGLTIENKIVGGAIPKEYMNAVYAGLNEAMTTGVVAGYPVVDVHVEVVDGSEEPWCKHVWGIDRWFPHLTFPRFYPDT